MEAASTYLIVPFLSGLFNVLIDRLASEKTRRLLMGQGLSEDQLAELEDSLTKVRRAVNDAEKKQDDDPDVKVWLDCVKHTLYDAEDLIDKIHAEQQNMTDPISRITTSLRQFAHSVDPFYDSEIKIMNLEFMRLAKFIDVLGLKTSSESRQPVLSSRLPATSSVGDPKVYGRDSEREQIIKILQDGLPKIYHQGVWTKGTSMAPTQKKIPVVAIVGMPGIGKTTLAQLIFNDPRVDRLFKLKSWVCVPEEFDIFKITKSILTSLFLAPDADEVDDDLQLGSHAVEPDNELKSIERILYACDDKDMVLFHGFVHKRLAGRRFLMVLDDVWDENFDASWDALHNSLGSAAAGSTIIVTTRNKDIARRFHPIFTLELRELSDGDCWSMIKEHAFDNPHAAPDESLEVIGRKIAAKCRGLPLAAKALGGLLIDNLDPRKWEDIENSGIWDLRPGRGMILPALLLSYNFLPQPLRSCFAYCAIFPKNYQFQKEKLLLLWMAEGLLDPATGYNQVSGNCFDHLLARSFFQESSSNKHCFVMHDLIRELAVYIMGDFGFTLEAQNLHVSGRPRHFTYKPFQYEMTDRFGPIADPTISGSLRTFLPVRSFSNEPLCCLSSEVLQSLVQSFHCLRVLSLCGYNITSIPPSINSLKLLRYLDCSSTLIEGLPETLCSLYNLQTLLLSDCHRLKSLPSKIGNLTQMCHLDICGTNMLEEMPAGIGKISSLKMLTDFVIGKNQGPSIGELGGLNNLKGQLRIYGLENVVDEADAKAAKLVEKKHLEELVLEQEQEQGSSVAKGQNEILQELRPYTNLTRLSIVNYAGERFPGWVGHVDFKYLEVLHLRQCQHCIELPMLGQLPKLKQLVVEGFDQLQTVGPRFYGLHHSPSIGCFKSLETLKFIRLLHWEDWSTVEADFNPFPRLQELYVWDCPELNREFPSELPSLEVINISNCPKLCGSLPQSPFLRDLRLEKCGKVDLQSLACFTCIASLSLSRLSNDQIAVVKPAILCLTSLDSLTVKLNDSSAPCDELSRGWSIPSSVRSLGITSIHAIGLLLRNSRTLQYAHLRSCDSPSLQFPLGHSQLLNYLRISKFNVLRELQTIPQRDNSVLPSLCDLSIEKCPQLSVFPAEGFLADNLTTLSIYDCTTLGSLGSELHACFPSLRFLSVDNCPQLVSFAEDGLPRPLQTLCIRRCENLVKLPSSMSMCTSLQLLEIGKCPKLESIPTGDLPHNLRKLKIYGCETLRSFTGNTHSTLMCLELLHICDCVEFGSFPPGSLPPNLQILHVRNCSKLISNYVGWQLHTLVYLHELVIEGFEHEGSFPANGSLPSALTSLCMVAFPNLESINCTELKRVPCLRKLEIRRCQSLQTFSEDLPQSLCHLTISECPSLVAKCRGPASSAVSHIPCLDLDPLSPNTAATALLDSNSFLSLLDFFGCPLC